MRDDGIRNDKGGEPAEPKEQKKDESVDQRTQEGEIPSGQTKQGSTRPPVRGEDGPSDSSSREGATP